MSHHWKPGDKAVVDDPQSPRHCLIVWLLTQTIGDPGDYGWNVGELPGGPAVGHFREDQLRRPTTYEAGSMLGMQVALSIGVLLFFAWMFTWEGCIR